MLLPLFLVVILYVLGSVQPALFDNLLTESAWNGKRVRQVEACLQIAGRHSMAVGR